jgi:CubicO group peptidase (beta-lactamase class C family)
MRYAIGSNAKQFTAAAMLLLQQDGKLSLDDRVARHLPDVAHGNEVTIRQLLNHTAGYDDYWPQDYLPAYITKRADVPRILREWAGRPLTFPPGTAWGYSNTNYVVAGAIIERVSGQRFFQFLRRRIFEPLGMRSAFDNLSAELPASDAGAYTTYGLGPLRPAPPEASAWLFAAGNLAMTAGDLATWDLSIISRTLLTEASYREQATEARRADGTRAAMYGLGVELAPRVGRRAIAHFGGGSGYTSANYVFPAERAAVVVLTNGDSRAVIGIADYIARCLFAPASVRETPEEMPQPLAPLQIAKLEASPEAVKARGLFQALQKGELDRSLFTDNANAFFTRQALADFAASLAPLGPPAHLWQTFVEKRGSMVVRDFLATFPSRRLHVTILETPDGRLEQYLVVPAVPQWR